MRGVRCERHFRSSRRVPAALPVDSTPEFPPAGQVLRRQRTVPARRTVWTPAIGYSGSSSRARPARWTWAASRWCRWPKPANELSPTAGSHAQAAPPRRTPRRDSGMPTFEEAVGSVLAIHVAAWKAGGRTAENWRTTLRQYAYPYLGRKVPALHAHAVGGGSPSSSGTSGSLPRNIVAISGGRSRSRWRPVRTTLASTCCGVGAIARAAAADCEHNRAAARPVLTPPQTDFVSWQGSVGPAGQHAPRCCLAGRAVTE